MLYWLTLFAIIYIAHKLYTRRPPLQLDKNSVVIITGACNGIGRQTARLLAQRHQCKLIILDIMYGKFKEVKEELEKLGSTVTCYKCDLSSEHSMTDILNEIRASGIMIDVLINNAGIVVPTSYDQQTYSDHSKTMAVNYLAPVFFTLGLKDRLKGHIVTVASVCSLFRGNNLTSYMASKHAVYGFYNCLRTELADQKNSKLSCSMVCPYAVDTGMFDGFQTRLNQIVPMLKEADVGRVVANTVLSRDQIVFVPFWIGFVIKLTSIVPEIYLDKLCGWLDTSNYKNNQAFKKA